MQSNGWVIWECMCEVETGNSAAYHRASQRGVRLYLTDLDGQWSPAPGRREESYISGYMQTAQPKWEILRKPGRVSSGKTFSEKADQPELFPRIQIICMFPLYSTASAVPLFCQMNPSCRFLEYVPDSSKKVDVDGKIYNEFTHASLCELIKADHRLFFSVLCWKHICAALRYLTPSDPVADDRLRIS